MLVNLSQKFFYDRELFKPVDNPVTLPEEAVEHLNDNDVIVEASAKAKARFEELKQERLDARSFESKDAVGKLQARLDVLEDKSPASGKDQSKEIDKLQKEVAELRKIIDKMNSEIEAVRKDSAASALSVSEQLAEITEAQAKFEASAKPGTTTAPDPVEPPGGPTPKAPDSEITPAKKTSTAL